MKIKLGLIFLTALNLTLTAQNRDIFYGDTLYMENKGLTVYKFKKGIPRKPAGSFFYIQFRYWLVCQNQFAIIPTSILMSL